ncbi:hypothetical protein PL10110_1010005 [Planktothrix agardhii]|nr:hypothetical protein PL10110_1010005 [Planktothrix agardhii]
MKIISLGNGDLTIHQRLQKFIEDGGTVIACPNCSRKAGLTQEDLIEGVVLGQEDRLAIQLIQLIHCKLK